jgi:hypothetical protein
MSNNQVAVAAAQSVEVENLGVATFGRARNTILGLFNQDADGFCYLKPDVTGKDRPDVDELWLVLEQDTKDASKLRARQASILRSARGMTTHDGKDAYKWMEGRMLEIMGKGAAFNNMKGLIPLMDFIERNGLTVSPYTLKNANNYIDKMKLVTPGGRFTEAAATDPVVTLLLEGKPAAVIAPVLQKEKDKDENKHLFKPKKGDKAAAAADQSAEAIKAAVDKAKEMDSAKFALEIDTLCNALSKFFESGDVEAKRKGFVKEAKALANMMLGLKLK